MGSKRNIIQIIKERKGLVKLLDAVHISSPNHTQNSEVPYIRRPPEVPEYLRFGDLPRSKSHVENKKRKTKKRIARQNEWYNEEIYILKRKGQRRMENESWTGDEPMKQGWMDGWMDPYRHIETYRMRDRSRHPSGWLSMLVARWRL